MRTAINGGSQRMDGLTDGDFVMLERSADAVDCELALLAVPVSITLT